MLLDEAAARELEDERPIERIELPVERVERLAVAEAGGLDPALDEPVPPALQLVVDEQADKVERTEVLGSGLLRSDGQHVSHAAQAQLAQRVVDLVGGHEGAPCVIVAKWVV